MISKKTGRGSRVKALEVKFLMSCSWPSKSIGGKRVLEVGVGTGRNASTLLEIVKPQLVGLDLTREMLRLAKMKMENA